MDFIQKTLDGISKDFGQYVTWLLVIFGWVVVHYLTIVRERQKNVLERKDAMVASIFEIEQKAISFHQAPTFEWPDARILLSLVERLAKALSRAPFSEFEFEPHLLKQLRQRITLKNFDISSFQSQMADSKIVVSIAIATEQLSDALEEGYTDRYMTAWWQVFRV